MKVAAKILVVFAAVVLVGALLAPPVYWLGRALVDAGTLPVLARVKFGSYFNRTLMILGLASIWPLLCWLGLASFKDLMLEPNPRRFFDLGLGALVGTAGFAFVLLFLYLGGFVALRGRLPWDSAWTLVLTAVAVPLIEETFFRGVLFGVLRRSWRWPYALAFLSFFFAILHFVNPRPGAPRISGAHWTSGFEHLAGLFWQFREPRLVLGGWVTLFLVGWILGYTVVRTRSLYLAMGLHGGWVLAMRFFDEFCRPVVTHTAWIGKDVRMGVAAVLLMLATHGVLYLLLEGRGPATPGNAEGGA
ncbi:MAG: CPBP family intramembrane metalloprotease [Deltaproteobacteria bacterium]|nr:CPBP family intramembrane metalloprotease [Deltaproteobacteria bacterium]